MPQRSFSDGSRGDEQLVRQLPALLRQHRPDIMEGEGLYRSPPGFTSWSAHWAKAVAVELALEQSESIADHVGIWGAKVCQWARETGAEPRFLSPVLAQAFLQTEQPTLTPDLPRSVVMAEVRAMEGWLPDNFQTAGGGLACVGLGEDGSTYLASNLLDPVARAQQPAHTDFSPTLWDWDAGQVPLQGFRWLPISNAHLLAVADLGTDGIHLDPWRPAMPFMARPPDSGALAEPQAENPLRVGGD